MRRRLVGLLLSALLAFSVLAPAAATAAPEVHVILATEAEHGEAPGPEPAPADDTENPAAPTDYEANFLWGFGGVILLVMMILGALALGAMYVLLVKRPQAKQRA